MLFANPSILEERLSDKDFLNSQSEIIRISRRLEAITATKRSAIVAYLGAFGVGKSTVLRNIELSSKDYLWINFELWRHSDRKEIWDSFVITVSAKLRGQI